MAQLGGMLFTFLVGVQLARGLGLREYGLYGLAMAVIALLSMPVEFGIPQLVTREIASSSSSKDDKRGIIVVQWAHKFVALVSVPIIALLALAPFVLGTYNWSFILSLALGAPMIALVGLTKIRSAILSGLQFVVIGQIPNIFLRPLVFSLLLFIAFLCFDRVTAPYAILANSISALIVLIAASFLLRRRFSFRNHQDGPTHSRTFLKSAFPIAIRDGLRVVQPQLFTLVLGLLSQPEEVGLFRIALALIVVVGIPLNIVSASIAPVLAKLHAESDHLQLERICQKSAQAMFVGVVGLTAPLVLFGPWIINVAFGIEYVGAYTAITVLCAGQLIMAGFGLTGSLLIMTGNERRAVRALAVALGGGLATALALVPVMGVTGAAWASLVATSTNSFITWIECNRITAIDTSVMSGFRTRLENGS